MAENCEHKNILKGIGEDCCKDCNTILPRAPVVAEQCLVTCADFPMHACDAAHRCVRDPGHPFDPQYTGEIHEFESHQTTVKPRVAATPAPVEQERNWWCKRQPWACRYLNARQCAHDTMLGAECPKVCECACHPALPIEAAVAPSHSVREAAETPEHKEKAREIVERFFPPDANPEAQWKTSLINAIASRDTEIREVLEGLRYSEVGRCWCKGPGHHSKACEATRALYAKPQPGK